MPTAPPPSSSPEPDPGPGPPLTEQEKCVLADLAAGLRIDGSRGGTKLSETSPRPKPWPTLGQFTSGALALAAVLVLLPADWLKVVAVLAVLVVLPLLLPLLLFLLAEPLLRSLSKRSRSARPPDEVP